MIINKMFRPKKKEGIMLAGDILNKLMETAKDGEWQSISLNITAGPNEAPVILAAILPGTTKENAIRIQNGAADAFKAMNK